MLMPWNELVAFLDSGFRELLETDYAQVRYGDVGMAVALAVAVGVVLALTLVRLAATRKRHARQHSGHLIEAGHRKRLWVRVLHTAPKALHAAALVMLVVSVADPFLTATEEVSGSVESRVRIDLVAGDLFLHESVERFVGIEGVDDPVSISPQRGPVVILAVSVRFGIPHEIQPVPGLSLAVTRAVQQVIDQFHVSIGRFIVDESINLGGRRWQSGQIEVQTPDQCSSIGLGSRRHFLLGQFPPDKAVDFIPRPAIAVIRRNVGFRNGLKGPPLPVLVGE